MKVVLYGAIKQRYGSSVGFVSLNFQVNLKIRCRRDSRITGMTIL